MPDNRLTFMRNRIVEALGGKSVETFCNESKGRFTRNTLRRWINGQTSPSLDDLVAIADQSGLSVLSFLPPENERSENVKIQKLDVYPAAGAGALNDAVPAVETLEFPLWMAQKLTKTARGKVASLRFMRALGDSMEPLIEPGALLLVDESDRDYRAQQRPKKASDHFNIYVFIEDGALRVKRLRVDKKGSTVALSENPSYDPEILHKRDFKVLGRVIWWDNRL